MPLQGTVRRCQSITSQSKRSFAVYAVGQGWTGALGTGRYDEHVLGHEDDDDLGRRDQRSSTTTSTTAVKVYDGKVHDIDLGWGHSAIVTAPSFLDEKRQLLVTGRPHEFGSLLKLQRLPLFLRRHAVRKAVQAVKEQGIDGAVGFHPAALVGRLIDFLHDQFVGVPEQHAEFWNQARQYSIMTSWTSLNLPNDEEPASVSCSAGLTLVRTSAGRLYSFGLNGFGQCGIGYTSNNVWTPTPVTGLTSDLAFEGARSNLPQSFDVTMTALGLQHGLCVNSEGELFSWGKGERGQLGQQQVMDESHTALPINKAFSLHPDGSFKPIYQELGRIQQVSAGMLHAGALNEQNELLIWGKHVLPTLPTEEKRKIASDARIPYVFSQWPSGRSVQSVACGSHHTAVLMDDGSVWALGIASDTQRPLHGLVELIPAGVLTLPVTYFGAHMDRTTVICGDGLVWQAHLFEDVDLQQQAFFAPLWVDQLVNDRCFPASANVVSVHRSWLHSMLVTDENDSFQEESVETEKIRSGV